MDLLKLKGFMKLIIMRSIHQIEGCAIAVLCLVSLIKQDPSSANGTAPVCNCLPACTEILIARTITYGVYPSAKVWFHVAKAIIQLCELVITFQTTEAMCYQ